jgi:hypothetical protein
MPYTPTKSLLLAFALCFTAGVAQAADPSPSPAPGAAAGGAPTAAPPAGRQPKWVTACQADVEKHCKAEAGKGGGAVPACLKAHETELSEACEDAFVRPYKVAELCKEDITTHCSDAAKQGGLGKCLKDNKEKLSDACRSALSKGSKEHRAEKRAEAKADAKAGAEAKKPAK